MMKTVKVRNLEIGAGVPKVIVPIVAKDADGIEAKGRELTAYGIDAIEWRADYYEDVLDIEKTVETAGRLRAAVGEIPVIFSFRTKKEGGEKETDPKTYTMINKAAAASGYIDIVDVEIFSGDEIVRENIENIHAAGCLVIGSSHDFHKTPEKDDIIGRLRKMQEMGADLPKIAVMPQTAADVVTMQAATEEFAQGEADRPIITISMGAKGVITRIAGEVFGSAMTFGAVGETSAPGQIPVKELQTAIAILHRAL